MMTDFIGKPFRKFLLDSSPRTKTAALEMSVTVPQFATLPEITTLTEATPLSVGEQVLGLIM